MKIEKPGIIEGKNKKILKNIRLATQSDFNFISKWLKEEFDKYGEGFWNNISVIADCFNEKQLFVYIYDNVAIGFITGPIDGPSILNVRRGYRRRGIGRNLFEHVLDKAIKNKISVIKVECSPRSSINFWKKMGFSIGIVDSKILGHRIIQYQNKIICNNPVQVNIKTYSEDIFKNKHSRPLLCENFIAFLQNDGRISLQSRLFLKMGKLLKEFDKDLIVLIKINNEQKYFDKAKYKQAEDMGIKKLNHSYGFYIDYLNIKDK